MTFLHRIATVVITMGLAACGRSHDIDSLPPCDEPAAAALDTTRWRAHDGGNFPSLTLPPEFALDRSLGASCLHGGIGWRDTTVADGGDSTRSISWCIEDRMPRIDSPDSVLLRLPLHDLPTVSEPGDALCVLSFPVLGQRMALHRIAEDTALTFWRWGTVPLEHGEPLYLLARGPAQRDQAVVVRALRGMRWTR